MGYVREELTVTARLSNHNSDQDDEDRAAWAEFTAKVRALADEPRYGDLAIDMYGAGD